MSVLISSVEDTLRGSTFVVTRNGQQMLIWKSTQVNFMLVLGSPGTLLSDIKRSLMVLADFHDMLEILIFRAIIVVCHVKAIITVNLKAALRVPPAVTRLTVYRRLHILAQRNGTSPAPGTNVWQIDLRT